MDISAYFQDVVAQNRERLAKYFAPDARVFWHNTNESFSAAEFIRANCEYPGRWEGKIERLLSIREGWVLVGRVWEKEEKSSFHVVSFIRAVGEKIVRIDEYWGDDAPPPQWRLEKRSGTPISKIDEF